MPLQAIRTLKLEFPLVKNCGDICMVILKAMTITIEARKHRNDSTAFPASIFPTTL